MSDLDRLIEAVQAGTAKDFRAMPTENDAPSERAKKCGWAASAYRGDLNSAKRLHDALLPGWKWTFYYDGECGVQHPKTTEYRISTISVGDHSNPARAWLLAILQAVKVNG